MRDFLVMLKVLVAFLLTGLTLVLPFVCVYFFSEGDLRTTARLLLVWLLVAAVLPSYYLFREMNRRRSIGEVLSDLIEGRAFFFGD